MSEPTIVRVPGAKNRERLVAEDGDVDLGYMTLARVHDEGIIIDHTVVHAAAKGRGVGEAMFWHVVEWARREKLYVVPICEFVKSRFEKYDETADIRATSPLRQARARA